MHGMRMLIVAASLVYKCCVQEHFCALASLLQALESLINVASSACWKEESLHTCSDDFIEKIFRLCAQAGDIVSICGRIRSL